MIPPLQEDLAAAGIELKPVHRPRTGTPLFRIVVPAGSATDVAVAATAASLLSSACQDFVVDIIGLAGAGTSRVGEWLSSDGRFRHAASLPATDWTSEFILVLPAGTRLGTFSLEALADAKVATGASLLRALVDGQRGAVELWDTKVLAGLDPSQDPEQAVRSAGNERWISGSSVGLHDYRQPAPKMHLRKGAAGRHDLTIIVRDATDPSTRADYEQRIRRLEAKLLKSDVERRRLEAGIAPKHGLGRVRAAAKRGPGYLVARARTALGRVREL
ncbi:MAG: hypothetical protein JWQ75_230 [Pseudarthrobacter sp.]|nr:hypothetical protein [Pseudarthrobacter sp.]